MYYILVSLILAITTSCNGSGENEVVSSTVPADQYPDTIPSPSDSKVNRSKVIGWTNGAKPVAPDGYEVTLFAADLEQPRIIFELPNGDILVSESRADRIRIFRDANEDGVPETNQVFLDGLNKPFGIALAEGNLYVGNQDGLMRFPYSEGILKINDKGEKLLELPAGGYNHHWTRNVLYHPQRNKLYISVGSASNVGEYGIKREARRAAILETDLNGKGERIYAWGLRNPVGLDIEPGSQEIWTVVNERDGLGDSLVPDYLTCVRDQQFYGWPWYYLGERRDPRFTEFPDTLPKTNHPDYLLESHVAPLGLCFTREEFEEPHVNGVFIAQHGSWNRSELVGYNVIFVPFSKGKPSGESIEFLSGFIADRDRSEVYGRPVDVTITRKGEMFVTDDGAGVIWRIVDKKKAP